MLKYIMVILIGASLLVGCSYKHPKYIQGPKGDTGNIGAPGNNGSNSIIEILDTQAGGGLSCAMGGLTLIVGVDLNSDNALQAEEAQSSKDVCNGITGLTGAAGSNGLDAAPTPYTPVGIVDPCGDTVGIYDEVFLRLSNGILIASFSDNANGKNTRWSILVPGSYVTTDGSNCSFTVDANGNVL
jgi:hypothetical protein